MIEENILSILGGKVISFILCWESHTTIDWIYKKSRVANRLLFKKTMLASMFLSCWVLPVSLPWWKTNKKNITFYNSTINPIVFKNCVLFYIKKNSFKIAILFVR